jgi:endoglycosylceramidase
MVSWMQWAYCLCHDPTTSGQDQGIVQEANKPPSGENLNAGTLGSLVGPYPQVVAGTPSSWSFDRQNRTFTLLYKTQLPGGGRVKSAPDAAVLKVTPCRGAREVAVTVAPGLAPSQGC